MRKLLTLLLAGFLFYNCETEIITKKYLTQNVIIVVIDGPRYSETWGDSEHQYIPRLSNQLSKEGVVFSNFYNNGPTRTVSGHTAISTGNYQEINNSGLEFPEMTSIFQYWSKAYSMDKTATWIIASKDKLEVLSNCNDPDWMNLYNPSTNCGIGGFGIGSGNRHDSITFTTGIDILSEYHPQLALIHFREPDYSAHANNWPDYLNGITNTDEYVYNLWSYLETDEIYKGTTTLFVTNDHGRHLDGIKNGFISHGDSCEGCRHINLFAAGPDFKNGVTISTKREQIDIPSTIAELMKFKFPTGKGEIMYELFK